MSSSPTAITDFITRWQASGAAERSNYALFLSELCDILEVPRPDPSGEDNASNDYVIDRAFTRLDKDGSTSTVYLDLYKRGHFVLETKQGSTGTGGKVGHGKRGTIGWDKALDKAYHQARAYIRDLPNDHGRPPFLIVVDVGHCIDLYAEFTGTGGQYLAFPNPAKRRIFLEELHDPETRDLLTQIWTAPQDLDPSAHAAKVTREVADTLAELAASLEKEGHDPQVIATFLQRLLFTLFAEDVGLLPEKSFEKLLEQTAQTPQGFTTLVRALWQDMAQGSDFSTVLMQEVLHFNGGLFENPTALPLDQEQINLLVKAAKQDWKEVEPAIFGTLLERALDPRDRHKLGAHYTPRSYVDRLIEPTIMEPLRKKWDAVKAAAALFHDQDEDGKARAEVERFHTHLIHLRVLDPACGSGNFLYAALARLKELEAEVLDLASDLGGSGLLAMAGNTVSPEQFLGIEVNERAAAIAQLVLWIGFFQWHLKTTGKADTKQRPLLKSAHTIECRDAVLAYDEKIPLLDEDGKPTTIWDGETTKPHPVTGKEVPDETARKVVYEYVNPRRTEWPECDYIVGNPPFLGASRMRDGLGDGYVEALRKAFKKFKPDSWDFVMFWWHHAAELVRDKKVNQFGFITTNSIHQTFNRRCLEFFLNNEKKPVSLTFAIPDHPWVDSVDGAAVRIAMSVLKIGTTDGQLTTVIFENPDLNGEKAVIVESRTGNIHPSFKIGANPASAVELAASEGMSSMGMKLHGRDFLLDTEEAEKLSPSPLIQPFLGSRDVVQISRELKAIDTFGLEENELLQSHPKIYQHLRNTLYPERQQNNRESYRRRWWIYGEPRSAFRPTIAGLDRLLVTPRTAKHRIFLFIKTPVVFESELVCIANSDSKILAQLSSTVHSIWALNQGGRLEDRPRYNNSRCFETFPFPDLPADAPLTARLRDLGERLDSHRKRQQAAHPDLTLTGIYNVLEKLRQAEPLSEKEKVIHDQGLVTLLKQIHDEIDEAVLAAYGWTLPENPEGGDLPLADRLARGDEDLEQWILQHLVDLNHERAAEEARGKIRFLRPEFQDPDYGKESESAKQGELEITPAEVAQAAAVAEKLPWPKTTVERVASLKQLLQTVPAEATVLSASFKGSNTKKRQADIQDLLDTLASLGQL